MEVITHGTYLGKLDFAIIAFSQVLHKRVQRLLYESILQALVFSLLTEHIVWDFFCFSHRTILQLEQLGPIVTILVSFATCNKLSKECEPRLLLERCEVLIVLNQDLILFLSPLILVDDVLFFFGIFVSHCKLNLLVLEHDILVVGAIHLTIAITIFFFVDETRSGLAHWIVAQNLILDFFSLESEHGLEEQHRIVSLKLDKFTDNYSHNLLELISAHFEFSLTIGVTLRIVHNASH